MSEKNIKSLTTTKATLFKYQNAFLNKNHIKIRILNDIQCIHTHQ